jgi:hypothetical protein
MLTFDIAMPTALFVVTLVAMLLNRRIEDKLKTTFEERELRMRDAILFVVMISVAVSVIVFIPQMAITMVFLFSYSTLLFTFSYIFSGIRKRSAQLFCLGFGVASLVAGTVAILDPFAHSLMFYGAVALLGLAAFAFVALVFEQKRSDVKQRWYLAVMPPILFVLLFLVYNGTSLWFPFLLDAYGVLFAVLIILYLGSLFTWKSALIFAGLLTIVDIILVLVTGIMVTAAQTVSGLGLPVLISLPTLPLIITERGIQFMSLGLGDFFFAGILATQTFRKFGKQTAVLASIAMSVSFGIFEALLLTYRFGAFPGTLMIICGWLPVVAWKILGARRQKQQESREINQNRNLAF